jgi:hypothetical protein
VARSRGEGGISPKNRISSPVGSISVLGCNFCTVHTGETSGVRGGWLLRK